MSAARTRRPRRSTAGHPARGNRRTAHSTHVWYTDVVSAERARKTVNSTWWVSTEQTHGEEGQAMASPPWSLEGTGAMHPDLVFTGTEAELVAHLREQGYTDVDVSSE